MARLLNLSIAEKTLAHCGMYAGNELMFLCVERINHFFTAYDFLNGKEILRIGCEIKKGGIGDSLMGM